MIRTQHRTKGASALGATAPGEPGPFGRRPDLDEDDEHDLDQPERGLHMVQDS
ncbi:MAG: hypothetical protein HOY79_07370 [Streptomyces sp.]|nr:hypothetical protein [Streptomyces sp.]